MESAASQRSEPPAGATLGGDEGSLLKVDRGHHLFPIALILCILLVFSSSRAEPAQKAVSTDYSLMQVAEARRLVQKLIDEKKFPTPKG